jgi:DNA-directed RNA polymerase specialized sigma subunit
MMNWLPMTHDALLLWSAGSMAIPKRSTAERVQMLEDVWPVVMMTVRRRWRINRRHRRFELDDLESIARERLWYASASHHPLRGEWSHYAVSAVGYALTTRICKEVYGTHEPKRIDPIRTSIYGRCHEYDTTTGQRVSDTGGLACMSAWEMTHCTSAADAEQVIRDKQRREQLIRLLGPLFGQRNRKRMQVLALRYLTDDDDLRQFDHQGQPRYNATRRNMRSIAAEMKLSRQRVCQLEQEAMAIIRDSEYYRRCRDEQDAA